jgi:hypothetical protein
VDQLLLTDLAMVDLDRFEITKLFRRSQPIIEPHRLHERGADDILVASDDAASLAMARFRYVEPSKTLVQSWPADLGVTIVMLTGKIVLATEDAALLLQRDDVVGLGPQQGYALGNHPASDQGAWFVEFWMRRKPGDRLPEHELHVVVDRHHRIGAFVNLVPIHAPGPHVASVILYPGDVVTRELRDGEAAYVVSTVGTMTINGLRVCPMSAAMLHGPGRAAIRAVDSTEVLSVAFSHAPQLAARFAA